MAFLLSSIVLNNPIRETPINVITVDINDNTGELALKSELCNLSDTKKYK